MRDLCISPSGKQVRVRRSHSYTASKILAGLGCIEAFYSSKHYTAYSFLLANGWVSLRWDDSRSQHYVFGPDATGNLQGIKPLPITFAQYLSLKSILPLREVKELALRHKVTV